jgi:hypothetical protein
MLRCVNGHTNPETAVFCAACGVVMPPVERERREVGPSAICWRVDAGEPAAAGPSSLDEIFSLEEPSPVVPSTRRRRRRRWHARRVTSG